MVQNTKIGRPYWLENLQKTVSYVNSEDFLDDLESGKYKADKHSMIYLNLEKGTVSMNPVFGSTLKTVKLSFWNIRMIGRDNKSIQNGISVTRERFNKFISEITLELNPTLKQKSHSLIAKGDYPFCLFDKLYQKKVWDKILIDIFNTEDFCFLGFNNIFNIKEFSFNNSLSKEITDLFFESFYCDDDKELLHRMFLYNKNNELSERAKMIILEKLQEKVIDYNKKLNPENKLSYSELFSVTKDKTKKIWFNSFYARLVIPSYNLYKSFGVQYPEELDDILMSTTKIVLDYFEINSLFVSDFVEEMLKYIPEEKLSSFDVTVVLDSSEPSMLVSWDEKFKFSPSAYYSNGDVPDSDTFFAVPDIKIFELLSKFRNVVFRLGDDSCEPSIWPELTSKLINFWIFFEKNKKQNFDFKVDDNEFIKYLKFGGQDPKYFIYFNKKIACDCSTTIKYLFGCEDLVNYYNSLLEKIS